MDEKNVFNEMAGKGCKNWEVCRLYSHTDVPYNETLHRSRKGDRHPESVNISCEAIGVLLKK